jgi:uncharacterized membrane protein YhhN
LLAEARGRPGWLWLAKPLASAAFLWAAVAWGAAGSGVGFALLVGLALCALGDVLLIRQGAGPLLHAGMAVFGLGHLTFAAAFSDTACRGRGSPSGPPRPRCEPRPRGGGSAHGSQCPNATPARSTSS